MRSGAVHRGPVATRRRRSEAWPHIIVIIRGRDRRRGPESALVREHVVRGLGEGSWPRGDVIPRRADHPDGVARPEALPDDGDDRVPVMRRSRPMAELGTRRAQDDQGTSRSNRNAAPDPPHGDALTVGFVGREDPTDVSRHPKEAAQ